MSARRKVLFVASLVAMVGIVPSLHSPPAVHAQAPSQFAGSWSGIVSHQCDFTYSGAQNYCVYLTGDPYDSGAYGTTSSELLTFHETCNTNDVCQFQFVATIFDGYDNDTPCEVLWPGAVTTADTCYLAGTGRGYIAPGISGKNDFYLGSYTVSLYDKTLGQLDASVPNLFGTDWDTGVPADPGSWTTTPAAFQEVTSMTPSDLSGISLSLTIAHSP